MELSTITDLDKLKSLAYDEIAKKEQAENNLRLVNQRILDITTAKNTVVSEIAKKKAEMDAKAAADQDPAAASDDSESTDSESTDSESTGEQAADN
jgi:F0F1-type ATP synthase epsilon subunit